MVRPLAAMAIAAVLAAAATACGDAEPSAAAASSAPTHVGQVDRLSRRGDRGRAGPRFVEAPNALRPQARTPIGAGEIAKRRVPVTGGTVTYSTPGSVAPIVQGEIGHSPAASD
jgi:hypothetical protein